MPRAQAPKGYNTFVKGLVTESSPINHPDNYASDLDNVVLGRDGSIQRRSGIDYENSAVMSANISVATFEDAAISEIVWNGAANNPLNNFLIQQIGDTLYIHDLNAVPIGAHKTTIDLNTFASGYTSSLGINPVQGAYGKGVMFIVGHDIDPFYIEYDEDADTFSTSSAIEINVRDFDGVSTPGIPVTKRVPLTEPDWYSGSDWDDDKHRHFYNLYNQGWSDTNLSTMVGNWFQWDAVTDYSSQHLPAANMIMSLGKDSSDNFSEALLEKQDFGNSPAPKGHFILNDFYRDRRYSSWVDVDEKVGPMYAGAHTWTFDAEVVYDESRPQAVGFYAGRVFYAGQESKMSISTEPDNSGKIYFSPILSEINEEIVGRCHQLYDPTSEHLAILLPADGGVIQIAGVGKIYKMYEMNQSLVIISDAGVWTITGGSDVGFTASAYIISQVSSIGGLSATSVVKTQDGIFYWAENGIHLIAYDPSSLSFNVRDITEEVIQDYYAGIDSTAKLYSKGTYDKINKTVRWLYNDDSTYDGVSYRYKYNRELVLDLRLGAFYTHTLGELATLPPYVAGAFPVPNLISSDQEFTVYDNSDNEVQDASLNTVTATIEAAIASPAGIKYMCVEPQVGGTNSQYTYGLYRDPTFYDWVSADSTGISYSSYIETGHDIDSDLVSVKQASFLYSYFKRTEEQWIDDGMGNPILDNPSSCMMTTKWDFSDHTDSGKFSTAREIYRLNRLKLPSGSTPETINYGHEIIVTKNRLRGTGRALKVRFESSAGKDMYIYGWAIMFTGATGG